METAEEFAKRIERQARDCECAECMRPLIEADRSAVALAVLDEVMVKRADNEGAGFRKDLAFLNAIAEVRAAETITAWYAVDAMQHGNTVEHFRAKLSTSEARARKLEMERDEAIQQLHIRRTYHEVYVGSAEETQRQRDEARDQLSDTRTQLLAEQARGRGLESKLNSITIPIDPLLDAVVEAARRWLHALNSKCTQAQWNAFGAGQSLHDALSALDTSSKPDAPAPVAGPAWVPCPECDDTHYHLRGCPRRDQPLPVIAEPEPDVPAPIAEPEPAERPIVVGSIVKHLPSGQFRKVSRYSSDPLSTRPFVFEHPIQNGLDEVRCAGASELELVSDPVPSEPSE